MGIMKKLLFFVHFLKSFNISILKTYKQNYAKKKLLTFFFILENDSDFPKLRYFQYMFFFFHLSFE